MRSLWIKGPAIGLSLSAALLLIGCSSAMSREKISEVKTAMKMPEVESILGRPDRIEQSETLGLHGQVLYYSSPTGEGEVTLLNDGVFKAEFLPTRKST